MRILIRTTALLLLTLFISDGYGLLAQEAVLVFSKTEGYRHASIAKGVTTLKELGTKYGYQVTATEDASTFSPEGLAPYQVVVFLNTTGDVLNLEQQLAFEDFIGRGNGFVGIHAAADTEYDWTFFRGLVGRQFVQHPEHQLGKIITVDSTFAGMAGFGESLTLFEEWYEYTDAYADNLRYLYRIDTSSYSRAGWKGKCRMGDFHPLGWYHEYGGGRAFYTGIGHMDSTYQKEFFRSHLASGIHWAATGKNEMPKPSGSMLGLRTTIYLVPDLASAKTWYAKAFDLQPYFEESGYVGFTIGGYELGLMPRVPTGPRGSIADVLHTKESISQTVTSYWGVEDIETVYNHLISLGAVSIEPPKMVGGPILTARVADPWGNPIGLIYNPAFKAE